MNVENDVEAPELLGFVDFHMMFPFFRTYARAIHLNFFVSMYLLIFI